MCLVLWSVVYCFSVMCIFFQLHTTLKLVPEIVKCFYSKLSKQMPLWFILLLCCYFVTVNSTLWHFLLGFLYTFECFLLASLLYWLLILSKNNFLLVEK
jgi:hypothetical protein